MDTKIIMLIILVIVMVGLYYFYQNNELSEVFYVGGPDYAYIFKPEQAPSVAKAVGGVVATNAQLQEAHGKLADWCASGFTADAIGGSWPTNTSLATGCGDGKPGIMHWTPASGLAGVNVYGVKPKQDKVIPGYKIYPFNASKWSQYS